MQESDAKDRRRFTRVFFREPVQYHFHESGRFGGCLAGDISEGGIRVNFNDFIPLGKEIRLEIFVTMYRMIECIGRVVWVQKLPFSDRYQAGVEFIDSDSSADVKNSIRQLVSSANQN